MNRSPLGMVMQKIGLQIGVDTGNNLNKFLQYDQKPQQDSGNRFNSSQQKGSSEFEKNIYKQ